MSDTPKSIKLQSIKGFYDILPEYTPLWQKLEDAARQVMNQYGYHNIRMPIVEPTELFVRSVGEHTDIVEKEMYSWVDSLNEDKLTLRPEGTAGCVRAVIEHSLTYNGPQRLWYAGPMFRHENVQKGRQRQFHQVGAEAFGYSGPEVEAEQILLLARLWKKLGLAGVELQINTLGDANERVVYRNALIAHFEPSLHSVNPEISKRLYSNPLRILDSKDPAIKPLIETAPKLIDFLGDQSRAHFDTLCRLLKDAGIAYKVNTHLVRGLDYYNRTVFEWVTTKLGSQGTIAAGGRYDTLVEKLGGEPTPACGFAIGLERIFLLMQEAGIEASDATDVYLVNVGDAAEKRAAKIAETLRDTGLAVMVHTGGGSFKSQMKKADKSGSRYALILGDDEVQSGEVSIKPLRKTGEQVKYPIDDILNYFKSNS